MTMFTEVTRFPNGMDVGTLYINGVLITASAAELNIMDGVTATAAELNKLDGATVTTAEINLNDGQPATASFTIGAEAADTIIVGIQLKDANGADVADKVCLPWYFADDAVGDVLIAVVPTGAVTAGADGTLIQLVAKTAGLVVSEGDGDIDISIVTAGAKTMYIVLVMPNGTRVISPAITFAAP